MQDSSSGLTSALDTLANIAYQFGPFFFAVLFTLVITRTARQWYLEVRASNDPEEKKAYRTYFRASWLFGMLLCATSVAWWVRSQWEGHHAFAGTIVALNSNQTLRSVSDDQYFWSRLWAHQGGGALDTMTDYWFVVVSDHPVYRGEKFRLNYWDVSGPGALGQAPPPTAMIEVPVTDPTKFPQKYTLVKNGQTIQAVPYN
jgi:hypothetical protein